MAAGKFEASFTAVRNRYLKATESATAVSSSIRSV
jgi:hypothetical protein